MSSSWGALRTGEAVANEGRNRSRKLQADIMWTGELGGGPDAAVKERVSSPSAAFLNSRTRSQSAILPSSRNARSFAGRSPRRPSCTPQRTESAGAVARREGDPEGQDQSVTPRASGPGSGQRFDSTRRRVTDPEVAENERLRRCGRAEVRSKSLDGFKGIFRRQMNVRRRMSIRHQTDLNLLSKLRESDMITIEKSSRKNLAALIAKVRLYVHCAAVFMRLYRRVIELHRESEEYAGQLDMVKKSLCLATDDSHEMFFDASYFQAVRQMRMNDKSRAILSKDPDQRSDDDVKYAMISIRAVPVIADYPVRMQKMMATRGRFVSYDGGRILIKQNQVACCFYIILFGSVMICVRKENDIRARTKCYLNRGETFGELALIEKTVRQATVITRTYTEFLLLDNEAYRDIFLTGKDENLDHQTQINFLHSLTLMKNWPVENLFDDPKVYLFHYFRRGSVIVKNTRNSKWIYIVRTGSARVLKMLREEEAKPLSVNTGRPAHCSHISLSTSSCRIKAKVDAWNLDYKKSKSEYLREKKRNSSSKKQYTPRSSARSASTPSHDMLLAGPCHRWRAEKSGSKQACENIPQEKRSLADVLEEVEDTKNEVNGRPVFIHVQTLRSGQVFGLESMLYGDQPTLSLVSDGAECMLLNKKYYLKYCPLSVLNELRKKVFPYPSDETLQQSLKVKINWEVYKQELLGHLCEDKESR